MKKPILLTTVAVLSISTPIFACNEKPSITGSAAPMHDKEKCNVMSRMKPMMEAKQAHMRTVEERLANIENLLRQLVEQQTQNPTN